MPLNKFILHSAISSFNDSESTFFIKSPENAIDTADKWGVAIKKYARNMIPPSTAHELAKSAFVSVLSTATAPGTFNTIFPQALMTYITTIIPGMLPNFVATPPTSLFIMTDITALGVSGATANEVNILWVQKIDAWFKTGTYSTVTPTGTVFMGPWL